MIDRIKLLFIDVMASYLDLRTSVLDVINFSRFYVRSLLTFVDLHNDVLSSAVPVYLCKVRKVVFQLRIYESSMLDSVKRLCFTRS